MKYSSLLRDAYSILLLLRGFCSSDDVRTAKTPSEVVVGGSGAIVEGAGALLLLCGWRTTEAGNDHFCVIFCFLLFL